MGVKQIPVLLVCALSIFAQGAKIAWTQAEEPLAERIRNLRSLPDTERPGATRDLALRIRRLPATPGKETLAIQLANLVTEGDPGQDTLQETATTLAAALTEQPAATPEPYLTLAQLVRYEHVQANVDDPRFQDAARTLVADDERRNRADFTLKDLNGKDWSLRQLRGKIVVVNFWATWCPPCRAEMPTLDEIYKEFGKQGLVILAITDETPDKVVPFLGEHPVSYPILLDSSRKVTQQFDVSGIPRTFIYDRSGDLAAESIDMRTRKQFLALLKQAGL